MSISMALLPSIEATLRRTLFPYTTLFRSLGVARDDGTHAEVAVDTHGVIEPRSVVAIPVFLAPVSYTHLDVYKRQKYH